MQVGSIGLGLGWGCGYLGDLSKWKIMGIRVMNEIRQGQRV